MEHQNPMHYQSLPRFFIQNSVFFVKYICKFMQDQIPNTEKNVKNTRKQIEMKKQQRRRKNPK